MAWGISTYNRVPIKRACNGYYLRWWYSGWHYWFFLPGKYTVNTQGENYKTIGTREIAMATGQVTRSECDAIRTIMNTREVYLLTVAGWMNIRIEPGSINVYNNMVAGSEFEFVAIIGSKEITYTTGYSPVPGDGTIPEVPVVPPDIGYCEVIIGAQIWMCKNWDSNYPNSLVYDNNEANRAIYGGLYNWIQVNSPGFCPEGWHVPSRAEWQTLIDYVGGEVVAGGILKEAGLTHWNAPNTGAVDTYGFSALGAGRYAVGITSGYFTGLNEFGYFWTSEMFSHLEVGYHIRFAHDGALVVESTLPIFTHMSVRLIKDTPAPLTGFWITNSKLGIFTLRLGGAGTITINWGDGTLEDKVLGAPANYTHNYTSAGHTIEILNYTGITYISAVTQDITALNIPETCVGLTTITLSTNQISSISLHKEWIHIENFTIDWNILTVLSVPKEWVDLINLTADNNHIHTFEAFREWVDLQNLLLEENAIITDTEINNILIECEASVMGAGNSVRLEGGTMAAPSGAGIVSKNNMIAAGVNVTTN